MHEMTVNPHGLLHNNDFLSFETLFGHAFDCFYSKLIHLCLMPELIQKKLHKELTINFMKRANMLQML